MFETLQPAETKTLYNKCLFLLFFQHFLLFEKHKIGKIANFATNHFGSNAASNACDPEIDRKYLQKEHAKLSQSSD